MISFQIFQHFRDGEVKIFKLRTTADLGDLLYVNVWHDNSGEGDYGSWYLDKVVIVDMADLMWYITFITKFKQ